MLPFVAVATVNATGPPPPAPRPRPPPAPAFVVSSWCRKTSRNPTAKISSRTIQTITRRILFRDDVGGGARSWWSGPIVGCSFESAGNTSPSLPHSEFFGLGSQAVRCYCYRRINWYLKTQPCRSRPSKFNNMKFPQSRCDARPSKKTATAHTREDAFSNHQSILKFRFQVSVLIAIPPPH